MARVVGRLLRADMAGSLGTEQHVFSVQAAPDDRREVVVGPEQVELVQAAQRHNIALSIDLDMSGAVADIQVPTPARIDAVLEPLADGDVEIVLEISHARHWLRRTSADFDRLRQVAMEYARSGHTALVTLDDNNSILDFNPGVDPLDFQLIPRGWAETALVPAAPMMPSMAAAEFRKIALADCVPVTPSPTCIPFDFPDDGCWARAHEMCRLLEADGVSARKAWIYGNLSVSTANNPNCLVRWRWHVAPVISLAYGNGNQDYVIDPSMFTEPVPLTVWTAAQGDPAAVLVITGMEVYYRSPTGEVSGDPDYTATTGVLARYRLDLQRRALQRGTPPYAACQISPTV